MKFLQANTWQFLFRPVSPATLGLLRIAFGVLMCWEFSSIRGYMVDLVKHSKFFITYDLFHWVKPCSPETMDTLATLGMVASVMLILGLFHRLGALAVFLCWTYMFLICRGHYTNHYYLFCLVGFWIFFTDGNRWLSLDRLIYKFIPATRSFILGRGDVDSVPYWQVLTFQLQIFLVYFYGGLAKISSDWMLGYPMRIWLPTKEWLPEFMKAEWVAVFMSWSGMVFDLVVGFVLFSRRRLWALPFVLFFHVTNQYIFRTIGGFPHFMAAATLIYFSPDWPQRLLHRIRGVKQKAVETARISGKLTLSFARKALLVFLLLYWTWQFVFPLRHFLYKGDPSITGEGAVFAWRMMLTARDYGAKLKIIVNGETFYITGESFFKYVNFRQFTRMCRAPKSFHRFALFIRDEMKKTDPRLEPEIYAFLVVSYNGRPYQQVIDTTVNLAALPYQQAGHTDWLRTEPFEEPPGNRYLFEQPIKD